jgi:acetoacetyl-CoA synthetase
MTAEPYGTKAGVKHDAECTTTEMLVSIWQRVLRLSSVDIHDDFFDIGGDSSLALLLFAEIGQAFGRDLPPVTIYQARTIAALGSLLEEPGTPQFPALVRLRAGSENQPVFLAHGLGGSVMDFFQPVRCLQTDRAIYGLQAKGSDGLEDPFESIEEMAGFYLRAIRELQPRGPYVLIGYSLGGLVALEMAQQLAASGEKMTLLAMLDAYPHMRHLAFGQRARLFAQQLRRGVLSLGELTGRAAYKPPTGVSLTPAMLRVRDAAYVALTRYQPRFYNGHVKFVRAAVSSAFPRDAAAVWNPLVSKLEVETVPGDHLGMIASHYEHLARVLSRHLAGAFAQS